MNKLKELVDELHLEQFYDDFERDDNSFKYIVELYAYKIKDAIYIGNRQIPKQDTYDYREVKYSIAEYWLNGNCDIFTVLYRYDNTSNSLYDSETGEGNKLANQKLLNYIKQIIIDTCNSNFNIQLLPEGYDIVEQIGKQISDWKRTITSSLKQYSIDDLREDLIEILENIQINALYWHKYLIIKNRFWFISLDENDIKERNILHFDELDNNKKAIIIVMKEWLAMIVNNSHLNPNYNMHIDKVIYKLKNTYYKNENLFIQSKSKFFTHKTAIKIILSLLYNSSTGKNIEDTYISFLKWRDNYIKYIFNK